MSQETEGILDRRRLRRKLGLWRGLAIIAAVFAFAAVAVVGTGANDLAQQDHIARIEIDGLITENRKQIELLKSIAQDDSVKGVIVFVNSPGGTTTGGEALFENLRKISAKKPVVAQFGTIAASAAYIAGLATDHIIARGNTITGSVGVIMQWPQFNGLLDKIGVKMNTVKSGDLKAEPSPFSDISPETKQLLENMIDESKKWFVGLVESRRKVSAQAIPGLLQGRVYSGREALKYKLIDEIGGEGAARLYLVNKRKLSAGLKVIDRKPKKELGWPFGESAHANNFVSALASWLGLDTLAGIPARHANGMMSVWQPSGN